jgi:hypothetical protein
MADHGAAKAPAWPMKNIKAAEELRAEIISLLPDGEQWIKTPHELLGGDSPEQRISAGDLKSVRDLLYSIVYIGIT